MARLNHNLAVSNSNPVNAQSFVLENMSSMAVLVPVRDLVQGHFPEIFHDQQLLDYMDTFQFQKNGIQNHVFRVAANVMEITPIALWIERFQTILTPEQWIVNTITEKLIADGASMPTPDFSPCQWRRKNHDRYQPAGISFSVLDRKRTQHCLKVV